MQALAGLRAMNISLGTKPSWLRSLRKRTCMQTYAVVMEMDGRRFFALILVFAIFLQYATATSRPNVNAGRSPAREGAPKPANGRWKPSRLPLRMWELHPEFESSNEERLPDSTGTGEEMEAMRGFLRSKLRESNTAQQTAERDNHSRVNPSVQRGRGRDPQRGDQRKGSSARGRHG